MKKQTLLKSILLSLFMFFSVLTSSSSAIDTIDAGFENRFEFSQNTIVKNERIKVYSYFDNNSEHDLKAIATFYVDNKSIEKKTFHIPQKTRFPVWTTIRISEPSELRITLSSLQKDTEGVLEGVYSTQKETKAVVEPGQAVAKLSKIQASISGSSKDVIGVADQTRLNINSTLEEEINEIKDEANKSDGLTFKKIWLWILEILNFIAGNFILSMIAFVIFVIYLYRYASRGYKKMKK